MAVYTYPPVTIDTTGLATEANQALIITELEAVNTELDSQSTTLTSIDGKDFATQTTLASLEAKDFATQTTLAALLVELALKADLTETQPVSQSSQPLPTGAATETTLAAADAKLNDLNARLGGSLAPVEHDELEITYVAAGNGAGEIETVVYKLATATVNTLTLSYDASNRLTGVVKS
jgi:hypothetical protein